MKSADVPLGQTYALTGGWGGFGGENAFAVSGAVRTADWLQFDGGVGVGTSGSVGGRAAAKISW